ncbi:MAG: SDR family oxidoreductase [Proteobacteria bacterium]|nr:SDR family oxidoreductase [Pseudomonadota bacterium]
MGTVLVTGANRGIGLELCRQLAARGDRVVAACRKTTAALSALGVRVEEGVDVADDASVAALAGRLGDLSLDLLISNAGVLEHETIEVLDLRSVRRQLEVNALGALRVTSALLDRLGPGAKIALISSRMGSIGDNASGGSYGYRMSKAALNMAGVSLAHDLRPRGIAVAILHPGYVRTAMTGGKGWVDAPAAAEGLLRRCDELTLESSGGFWHAEGERLPW